MADDTEKDNNQNALNNLVETSTSDIPVNAFNSMEIKATINDSQDDLESHSSIAVPSTAQESSSTQKYVPPHLRNGSTTNSSNERLYIPPTLKNRFTYGFSSTEGYVPPHLRNYTAYGSFNRTGGSTRYSYSLREANNCNKAKLTSLVKSEMVGKFTGLTETDISTEDFEWRQLNEENVRENVYLDLNEGYDRFIDYHLFRGSSINQLLKYIIETAKEGTSLKDATHGCDFLLNQNVLTNIAAYGSLKFKIHEENRPPRLHAQFVFTKFEGVIIGSKCITYRGDGTEERMKQIYHWVHKLDHFLTGKNLEVESDPESSDLSHSSHFGVFRAQITDSNDRTSSFFINAKIDGQNEAGKFIGIKEQGYGLVLKNRWHTPEPRWFTGYKSKWYFQAMLANIDEFVVGIHDNNGIVEGIRKLFVSNMENDEKQWDPDGCTKVLLDICDDVRKLLDTKPERSILNVELFSNRDEPSMTWIEDDERDQYELLTSEFVERFSTSK